MSPATFANSTTAPGFKPLTIPVANPGAHSYYFSLLGHTGPVAIAGYAGVFPMQSWSAGGAGQPGPAASSGQARSVNLQRQIDKGSPFLAQACASGKYFVQATVLSVSQGKTTLRAQLANVVISSYGTSNSGSAAPAESMTLNYASGSFF